MKAPPQLTDVIPDEFVEFRGDMLAYVRSRRGTLKFDWDCIGELLQQLFLVRAGLASDTFRSRLEDDLRAVASDERVRHRLWEMAGHRVLAAHGRNE